MTQAEAERSLTGGVSVGIQQFQREVECVLDGAAMSTDMFSLLGFGGKRIMKLRNLREPEVLEEIMDKEKSSFSSTPNQSPTTTPKRWKKALSAITPARSILVILTQPMLHRKIPRKQKRLERIRRTKKSRLIRQILEDTDTGYDAMGLYSELHARGAIIPEWVQNKPQVKQAHFIFYGRPAQGNGVGEKNNFKKSIQDNSIG